MNLHQRNAALQEIEKHLETCTTKEQIDRAVSQTIEVESKYADYLTELMEETAPDYIPMETR
jgi:hypothetical protein